MQKFKSKDYTISDFLNWSESEQLTLNPDFQRRDVWPSKARVYLIDTILNGKPIPKLFIREIVDRERKKTVRDVIDGQQRLRTIVSFYNNEFKVKVETDEYEVNGFYKDLPDELKDSFISYDLSVDVVQNMSQEEIIDVFARLNTFSFPLNRQELINSEFFGDFKTLVYQTSKQYTNFWVNNNIFTLKKINRMADAELMSDIVATIYEGPVARGDVKKIYKKYDDKLPELDKTRRNIHKTFELLEEYFGEFIANSNFRRPQLFFGLYLATYHIFVSQLEFLGREYEYTVDLNTFKSDMENLEYDIENESFEGEEGTRFYNAYKVQTTNKSSRERVVKYILDRAFNE
ncbi:DUF262 domain-containing protein [Halobacteriovorax marinus]|uniref:DUF262 domain-containing protein n=1 Tax=Halobacteriovorax marinus TaxID=97084 RepID=UPI003A914008